MSLVSSGVEPKKAVSAVLALGVRSEPDTRGMPCKVATGDDAPMAKRQRNVSVARGAPTHCGGGHNPLYPLLVSFDDLSWMLAGRDRTPETECRNFPGKQWFFSARRAYFWAM